MIRLDALGALDGLFFWTVEGLLPKPPHWLCFWMIASHTIGFPKELRVVCQLCL